MQARAQRLWQRGMAHFQQGNMEAAQANFESFLAREPGSGPGRFRLSMVHARRGRFIAAIALARQALDNEPNRVEIVVHLARCHLLCGHLEIARRLATHALSLPRTNAAVLDSLAVVMTRLDEQALAMELFDQALALDPNQASTVFDRAVACRKFGMTQAAEADLEACLALDPAHGKAHWTLANLQTQDLASNHVGRLKRQLDLAASVDEQELLALSLFKELDDLSDTGGAWLALQRAIDCRNRRASSTSDAVADDDVDALIARCSETLAPPEESGASEAGPIFIFGMPRSGVALLGSLLARHPKVLHLGRQQVFSRLMSQELARDSASAPDTATLLANHDLDHVQLGRKYQQQVLSAQARQLIICESQPMDFLLAWDIAKALPGARILHMQRDPIDTCVSILGRPAIDMDVPGADPAALATAYLDYHRLAQHWHRVLPGRVMDVSYESLVEKPEMILRVVCAFTGLRYASSLRTALELHSRSIGRGHRYAGQLPTLVAGLAALERKNLRG